jgi:hypothetical protein
MGLDVTAYERVTLLKAEPPGGFEQEDDLEPPKGKILLTVMEAFRATADGLVDGLYAWEGRTFGFGCGSYSYYNRWRRGLAELVGTTAKAVWDERRPGPFVELINNADNEGTIGPVTCAKLAKELRGVGGARGDVRAERGRGGRLPRRLPGVEEGVRARGRARLYQPALSDVSSALQFGAAREDRGDRRYLLGLGVPVLPGGRSATTGERRASCDAGSTGIGSREW